MSATSTTAAVRTRSAGIDLLRVVGIAAVVIGHVWGDGVTRAAIYTWHVPLFFVLTGYFWRPGRPWSGELRKRWQTLGLPYVTWLVILLAGLAVAEAAIQDVGSSAFTNALYGGSVAGRPFSAFWFVSVLFLIALAYRWLETFPSAVAWAVALVGLLGVYFAPEVVTAGPLGVFLVPACLVFVLSGRELRRIRAHASPGVGAVMVAAGALPVLLGLSPPLDMKIGDFGTPGLGVLTAVLISGGLIYLAEGLDGRVGDRTGDTIGRLAACGIAVVLSHAAVLWILRTREGGWLDLSAALLLPWTFAFWMLRTRVGPYLSGTGRDQR